MTTKRCPKCTITKSSDEFYKCKSKPDGLDSYCKKCATIKKKEYAEHVYATQSDKQCSMCGVIKPVAEFNKNATHGGYSGQCSKCRKVKWKENMTEERRIKYLINRIRSKCAKNRIPFNLVESDIIIPKRCPILDIPLSFGNKSGAKAPTDSSPSVDRIVPELGYVKDNIVVVSQKANRIKNDATIIELGKVFNFYQTLTLGS